MKLGKGTRRELVNAEQDAVFASVVSSVGSSVNRDAVISSPLEALKLNEENSRFGQGEIIEQIQQLQEAIREYASLKDEKLVPVYEDLASQIAGVPPLSRAAIELFDSCADLANSFIENGGFADQPPKVFPMDAEGIHSVKIGHRRVIAYNLAKPITGINVIDVLIDRSKTSGSQLTQTVQRIAENAARKGNTLAELLHSFNILRKKIDQDSLKTSVSKLSRSTGVERTKLTHIWEVVNSGFADNENLVRLVHDYKIEDAKSLVLVVKHPMEMWASELEKLNDVGSTAYRSKGSIAKPQPEAKEYVSKPGLPKISKVDQARDIPKIEGGTKSDGELSKKFLENDREDPKLVNNSARINSENSDPSHIGTAQYVDGEAVEQLGSYHKGDVNLLMFIRRINEGLIKVPSYVDNWDLLREFVDSLGID